MGHFLYLSLLPYLKRNCLKQQTIFLIDNITIFAPQQKQNEIQQNIT